DGQTLPKLRSSTSETYAERVSKRIAMQLFLLPENRFEDDLCPGRSNRSSPRNALFENRWHQPAEFSSSLFHLCCSRSVSRRDERVAPKILLISEGSAAQHSATVVMPRLPNSRYS